MENQNFQVGGINFPLATSTGKSLLQDLDPGLFWLLDYFPSVIQEFLGDRWNQEVNAAGRSDLDGYVVHQAISYDPANFLSSNTFEFPLLAVFNTGSTKEYQTITLYREIRQFKLLYIMDPLDSVQTALLHPFLKGVEDVIVNRTLEGVDSNYRDGLPVWMVAGIESIGISNSQINNFTLDNKQSNQPFQVLMMNFDIAQIKGYKSGSLEDLAGSDATLDGYNSSGDVVITVETMEDV
jgi:hypothetical protein